MYVCVYVFNNYLPVHVMCSVYVRVDIIERFPLPSCW